MKKEGLISLDAALRLSRADAEDLHARFVNSGLVDIMRMIKFNRNFVSASGVELIDTEGKRYLDFLGGYGAVNIGHNHPRVRQAIEATWDFPKVVQAALSPLVGALAHNLSVLTDHSLERTFFSNSGAEAVEAALKIARIYTGRERIISATGSFHGKTMGALSATGQAKYQQPFGKLVPGFKNVPYNDVPAIHAELRAGNVAAVILEPIQGEGGVIVPRQGYLRAVNELCKENGALLIIDAIQTGFGRTGLMFGYEDEHIIPDVLCLAKSLGGTLPIGATMTTDKIWQKSFGAQKNALLHTSTFGGNGWSAAAALAAIEVTVEEDLSSHARAVGKLLYDGLLKLRAEFPHIIADVRGKGLFLGIEFVEKRFSPAGKIAGAAMGQTQDELIASMIAGALLDKGVLTAYTLNRPNVIRIEPPLCITMAHVDQFFAALHAVMTGYKGFAQLAATQMTKKG